MRILKMPARRWRWRRRARGLNRDISSPGGRADAWRHGHDRPVRHRLLHEARPGLPGIVWRQQFSCGPAGADEELLSSHPVIASEAKQSRERLDCFVALLLAMTDSALPDRRRVLDAAGVPELVEPPRNLQLRS